MRTLLENANILASEGGGFRYIENGYLGIDGDTIDYIGPERPAGEYDAKKDMTGTLLIPGLVNAHTHTPMTLLRGVGSALPLQEWLFDRVFPIEDRLTPQDIRAGSELAILEMLASGVTSFSDMYMEPRETAAAVAASGMKANICRPVQSFDPNERPEDNFRVRESLELYDDLNGAADGRILVDFCIHAQYTCTEAVTRYYGDIVRRRGGNLHIHLSETEREHRECLETFGKTPLRWFYDLGALDARAFAAHAVWVTEEDMELMAELGVAAVHNPTSNLKLGSGFAPVPEMLRRGITVGLGTDGAASNNNLNMLEELSLASLIHSGVSRDPAVLTPADAITMATASGAKIQGRGDTGKLAVGMRADIAALSLDAPHMYPCLDPLALVTYSAQASDVRMTMVDGKILYENGEYLTLDREAVMAHAREAVKRLYA